MKRTVWAVFFAALLLASALLAGCGQKQGTLASFEWAIEPQYEFEKVEPVLDSAAMLEGTVCTEEGQAGFYLAETDEGWSVLNTATGELALEDFFIRRPVRCWMGHLYDEALYDAGRRYTNEQEMNYNRELAQIGSRFTLEIGHGGIMCQYLLEPDEGTVCLVSISDGTSNFTPVTQTDKAFRGLLPVSKGEWREEEMWEEIALERQPGSLYAVASPQGELLTDFVYDAAGMAGPELIAVQKGGRWGYVNDKGEEVIPCEYEPLWGETRHLDEESGEQVYESEAYPAPYTEGCVVVKKDGETGVLRADGSVLLAFGEVEDAAPAQGGLLWVRTGGRWGALRLPAGAAD